MAPWLARSRLALLCLAGLLLIAGVLAGALAPRSRDWFVREGNARLQGYTLALGAVAFRPWTLTLEFHDLVIRQAAHPEPAVFAAPRLVIDVEWRALLRGRVVARALLEAPAVVIDVQQLHAEAADRVPLVRRGWQRLPELYPLEVNAVVVRDGTLLYRAPDAVRPLRLTRVAGWIANIRHVEAAAARYPSPLHLEAVVFDVGRARFDGAADLLRHARPALRGSGAIDAVPLETLGPVLRDYPLRIAGGTLATRGAIESGPAGTSLRLAQVAITGIRVDWLGGADERQLAAVRRAAAAARRAARDPALTFAMDELRVDGEFGYVNRERSPPYRVFLDRAEMLARGLGNRPSATPATLRVSGRPMGSGEAIVTGAFSNGPGPPDFALDIRARGTRLPALNPLLRAHAGLDADAGTVSLYSQVLVRDGRIRGYVKPLLRDVDLYSREQDRDDGLLHRLYEFVADGVRRMLENDREDTIATVADLSGPVQDPRASTWQVIRNIARNAFVQALRPGFEERLKARPRREPDPPERQRPARRG